MYLFEGRRTQLFPEERRQKLFEVLKQHSSMSVTELAKLLNVSEATIRRDLNELQELGMIERTHGGALLSTFSKFEPAYVDKTDKFLEQKQKIGAVAASLIENGETIILDSGTTTLQVLKHLKGKQNITVITNAVNFAQEIDINNDIEMVIIGGNVKFNTQALVGPLVQENLINFHADKVFIAANGFTLEKGFTTPDITEAFTKRAMVQGASKAIAVLDHSKFGKTSLTTIVPPSDVDILITDSGINQQMKKEIENLGIQVIIAE